MKCIRFLFSVFLLLVFIGTASTQGTFIIAGVHDSTMTYHNLNPDSILPTGYYPNSISTIVLDVNQDGTTDFTFVNSYYASNAIDDHTLSVSCSSNSYVTSKFDTTTCRNNSFGSSNFFLTSPINLGDTIDSSFFFTQGINYLDKYDRFAGNVWCDYRPWNNQGDKYLGFKLNDNGHLRYGWIRLNVMGGFLPHAAIKDYAINNTITNIAEPIIDFKLKVYPNPCFDVLNIETTKDWTYSTIKIIDANGRLMYTSSLNKSRVHPINVQNLTKGVYIIQIETDNYLFSSKMLKL